MERERKALGEMRKALLILTISLMVGANCASHTIAQKTDANLTQATPTTASSKLPPSDQRSDGSSDVERKQDVPLAFKNIDFKNFAYPISLRAKSIRLKDGKYEYSDRGNVGGTSFELEDVHYTDLDGDGKREAVVEVFQLSCGVSCDGGSHLFYFFSMKHGKLTLLSRIESGSLAADGCGLKSFVLKKTTLVLEVFRVCRFAEVSLMPTYDPHPNPRVGKYLADKFTRFVLAFGGNRFRLKKREVFPNPQEDIGNYPSQVSISNE
jgi:hypothetical protein